jgi:hypothetical protein
MVMDLYKTSEGRYLALFLSSDKATFGPRGLTHRAVHESAVYELTAIVTPDDPRGARPNDESVAALEESDHAVWMPWSEAEPRARVPEADAVLTELVGERKARQVEREGHPLLAYAGALIVLGGSASAKSTWARHVVTKHGAEGLYVDEPDDDAIQGTATTLPENLNGPALGKLQAIDSMAYYTISPSGASGLGRGGVPRSISRLIIALDWWARARSQFACYILNIVSSDEDVMANTAEIANARCLGVAELSGAVPMHDGSGVQLVGGLRIRPTHRQGLTIESERIPFAERS